MTTHPCRTLSYLLAVMVSAAPLAAQSTTGTIQGVVTDNQGGVVPWGHGNRS